MKREPVYHNNRVLIALISLYWILSCLAILQMTKPYDKFAFVDRFGHWENGYWVTAHPSFIAVTSPPGNWVITP